jgi:hypothetical protein
MKRLLPLLLTALPFAAQAAPAFLPTHDVTVVYSVAVPQQQPLRATLSYQADSGLTRLDSPFGYYVLGNVQEGSATLVLPSLHALVRAPDFALLATELHHLDGASFTKLGTRHYAGLACTLYGLSDADGHGQVCLTRDGVVLRFTGHNARGTADVTALSVSSDPVEDDLFAPPAGYTPLELPAGTLNALLNPQ